MRSSASSILVAGLLVLLGIGAWGVFSVVNTVREATAPVSQLSGDFGTQVARVLNPSPTIRPDPVTIVREVRALARLETIQYTVEKVITAETGQGPFGFLFGDRLLLVAHGMVIAGVDLSQISPDDVWFDAEGRIFLRLPEAEIFVATLDNEASYIYDRDTGLLTQGDINLEAAARQAAEAEIRRAALEDGILDQAQVNAENFLFGFLRSLDFPDVIFAGPDDSPPAGNSPGGTPTP